MNKKITKNDMKQILDQPRTETKVVIAKESSDYRKYDRICIAQDKTKKILQSVR